MDAEVEERMNREHAEKYERLVIEVGIEVVRLRILWAASAERVVAATRAGDEHLITIRLDDWDRAADGYRPSDIWPKGLSLAERVCILKYQARKDALAVIAKEGV